MMRQSLILSWTAACLAMAILTACEFTPPQPASTLTPLPSTTATLVATQTVTASPTSPISTATATQPTGPAPLCQPGAAPEGGSWAICRSLRYGFEVSYPPGSALGEVRQDYARIDLPFITGTNLVEKYLEITTSQGAVSCASPLAQGFEPAAVPTQPVSFQSQKFYRQEGREGAAGNHYQWVAYSTTKGDVCVSLSFALHSTNPDNFATPPAEFDPQQESEIFDQIMATFRSVE